MGEAFLYGGGASGPYNGDVSTSIVNGVLLKGYTDGGAIANLVSNNVRNGVNIGGIVGDMQNLFYSTQEVNMGTNTTKTVSYNVGGTQLVNIIAHVSAQVGNTNTLQYVTYVYNISGQTIIAHSAGESSTYPAKYEKITKTFTFTVPTREGYEDRCIFTFSFSNGKLNVSCTTNGVNSPSYLYFLAVITQ